jgi:putative inorganic carbon (HCO3(-)) transporter
VIESIFAVIAAVCVGTAILDRPGRRRSAAMVVALILAPALIAGDQWQATQLAELRDSPALLLVALAAGGVLVLALALLMRRLPVLLPVLVLIALPFRVPLAVGGEDNNLLLPLYLVMAAGVLLLAFHEWKGLRGLTGSRQTDPDPVPPPAGVASWLKPLLALSVLLYALGLFWSDDQSEGLLNFCFFLVPFALVFVLMLEVEWDRATLRAALFTVIGLALVCAAVGFYQYEARELFRNEVVMRSNDFHVYFRVNSLFWDPNVYGRYLALVITAVAAALLWVRNLRDGLALAALSGVLWLALIGTFSQSSFIAILAGLAVLVALRWSLKLVLGGIGALAVITLLLGVFAGGLVKLDLDRLNPQTAGRADLVSGGIDLFADRPVAGYGSGSFSLSFREHVSGPDAPVTESHTEPITVAAEQGLIGLALYLALIVSSLVALSAGMRSIMPGLGAGPVDPDRNGPSGRGPPVAARAAILAAYVAVLIHTLTYAGYLDDPVTWVLIAIGYSLAFPCRATSAA